LALLLLLVRWNSVRAKANVPNIGRVYLEVYIMLYDTALAITFGGMWRCRRVAVARVFALVVRCRVIRLLLYSRVGKNRDTRGESPGGAGGGPYRRPQDFPL